MKEPAKRWLEVRSSLVISFNCRNLNCLLLSNFSIGKSKPKINADCFTWCSWPRLPASIFLFWRDDPFASPEAQAWSRCGSRSRRSASPRSSRDTQPRERKCQNIKFNFSKMKGFSKSKLKMRANVSADLS